MYEETVLVIYYYLLHRLESVNVYLYMRGHVFTCIYAYVCEAVCF